MNNEAAGLERAALAMLWTLGAGKASLMMSQPATTSEQAGLGLSAPMMNEIEMEPVLLQATVTGNNLLALLTRCTAQKAVGSASGVDIKQTLQMSMLRAGRTQYRIVAVTAKWFGGAELLYELEIEE